VMLVVAQPVFAQPQMPCGVYNDELRVALLEEHIATIERSIEAIEECMEEIADYPEEAGRHASQLARWTMNKEQNADALSEIVSAYFMAQRVAPVEGDDAEAQAAYVEQLTLLHEMLVYAAKAKQSIDLAHVEKLRGLLAEFRAAYFGEAAEEAPTDEKGIAGALERWKDVLIAQDVDKILAGVSEHFTSYDAPDKDALREFVENSIAMGYLDDAEVFLEDAETEIDGSTATVYPIDLSTAAGDVTIEFTLTKEEGGWLLTGMEIEGL